MSHHRLAAVLGASAIVASFFATRPAAAQEDPSPDEHAQPARDPDRPYRHGFTLELGIGLAMTSAPSDPALGGGQKIGLAPLSLGLGGFLNEDVALMFRAAGTSYFADTGGGETTQVAHGFYGPVLQVWASDDLFVRGGAGLGIYGTNPLLDTNVSFHETGVAFDAGVGWSFFTTKHHSLRVALDLFPGYYGPRSSAPADGAIAVAPRGPESGGAVLSGALDLEWQYF